MPIRFGVLRSAILVWTLIAVCAIVMLWRLHLGAVALAAVGLLYSLIGLIDELQDWRVAREVNGFREALARGHLRNELIRAVLLGMVLVLQLVGARWHPGDVNLPHVVLAVGLLTLGSMLDQRQLDWLRRSGGASRRFRRRRSDLEVANPPDREG